MPILFQKGILCTSNYNDMEHKPEIDGVELNENTTKEDLDIDKVFQYRGQVATYNQLPKTDLHIGDTYNVQDTGENYAWNGSSWDCLTGADAVYYKDSTLKSQDLALAINADNNTISNLETDNLKNGVLQTTVRDINTATDTNLASEKAIRTELNTKQNTITGAATTITSNDLTVSRALVSNANGKVAVSDITSTELGYLDGVTSNIQTQLNGKQSNITGEAGKVVYTTATAGTVEAQSLMDFNYITTTTTEFDNCKQSAPHTAYIINLQTSTVYAYDNEEENWIAQADTPTAIIRAGRFSFNRITTKLFFCTGNEILHMSTATLDAGGVDG